MQFDERPPDETGEEEDDVGLVGGGGPGATLPEFDDPDAEEGHLADTDHEEF